jgi:integrase
MATLRKRTNVGKDGIWEIQFHDEFGRKKTITLSGRKFTAKVAGELREVVATLIYEKINEVAIPHRKTKEWVTKAPLEIREKLARFGWCQVLSKHTAKEMWDTFLDKRTFKCESTRRGYLQVRERFFQFPSFKPNELLATLTQDRMRQWKEFLLDCGRFVPATVAGTLDKAKAVFNWAVEQKWITESPLEGVGSGSYRNTEQDRIVTMVEYRKLLAACPNQEWRVIIALARVGGLRPCEVMTLRWQDIDRENDRFTVYSPKLKGHKRYKREVPLFPEVLEELDRLRSIPGNEDREFIINRYSNRKSVGLWAPVITIFVRAGIGEIPRPFDNMRMSRSNEIRQQYGTKLESLWIGHTRKTADQYYTVATAEDYAIAVGKKVATWEQDRTVLDRAFAGRY